MKNFYFNFSSSARQCSRRTFKHWALSLTIHYNSCINQIFLFFVVWSAVRRALGPLWNLLCAGNCNLFYFRHYLWHFYTFFVEMIKATQPTFPCITKTTQWYAFSFTSLKVSLFIKKSHVKWSSIVRRFVRRLEGNHITQHMKYILASTKVLIYYHLILSSHSFVS